MKFLIICGLCIMCSNAAWSHSLVEYARQSNQQFIKPSVKHAINQVAHKLNRNLYVISGYRTRKTNSRYRGAKKSRHLIGCAVDISTVGWSRKQKNKLIKTAISEGFNGIGIYPTTVHLDIRDKLSVWGGDNNYFIPRVKRKLNGHLCR